MGVNRGKDFEKVIKEAFEKVPGVSIDRIHDQMNGYACSANISDFIMYRYPYEYYIECKSTHMGTLPFSNISDKQWNGMLEKSKITGVIAGVICWWIDKDMTAFIPIQILDVLKNSGYKSVKWDDVHDNPDIFEIPGKKKRVFYDYDMQHFFNVMNIYYRLTHQSEIPTRSGIWPK